MRVRVRPDISPATITFSINEDTHVHMRLVPGEFLNFELYGVDGHDVIDQFPWAFDESMIVDDDRVESASASPGSKRNTKRS